MKDIFSEGRTDYALIAEKKPNQTSADALSAVSGTKIPSRTNIGFSSKWESVLSAENTRLLPEEESARSALRKMPRVR